MLFFRSEKLRLVEPANQSTRVHPHTNAAERLIEHCASCYSLGRFEIDTDDRDLSGPNPLLARDLLI